MIREDAWQILCEYTTTDRMRKHALSVEAVMRLAAEKYGGDIETWGIVGLLHDFDYEIYPDLRHPLEGSKILEARGVPEEIVHAIQCHAPFINPEYRCDMDKAILAFDELTGFVTAVALVRPNKSLGEVEPSSVRKKMKDKAFARTVLREDIILGAEKLGADLDDNIRLVVEGLKPVAAEIGLNP
ncbi:MAG TPA: HDIG domain-containing protein [Dehalococcoidia bacterium]|nr:HDIG domain-containing protein [Dehalococcoidia bacterium]